MSGALHFEKQPRPNRSREDGRQRVAASARSRPSDFAGSATICEVRSVGRTTLHAPNLTDGGVAPCAVSADGGGGLPAADELILNALTTKVRMLSPAQVARGFYAHSDDPGRAAELALGRLERAGLVERREVLAGPELTLVAPLWTWRPGDAPPPHRDISRLARGRWTHAPRLERVVIATAKGRRLLGAHIRKAGLVKPLQARHDLNLAGVFTVYRSSNQGLADHWVGEDAFEPGFLPAGHVPDAVLLSPEGEVERAVEFLGSYPPTRVSAFCAFAMHAGLPFELW